MQKTGRCIIIRLFNDVLVVKISIGMPCTRILYNDAV